MRPCRPILSRLGWSIAMLVAGPLLPACDTVRPDLAYDPKPLAPAVPESPWPLARGERIPGATATLAEAGAASRRTLTEPVASTAIDPTRVYDLPGLIDVAQRLNPATRASWEQARAAAARLGIAEGAYLPTLGAFTTVDYAKIAACDKVQAFPIRERVVLPGVELKWLLLDFGRRSAEVDAAAQTLLANNLDFNRAHQEVTFAVQRGYYLLDASKARVGAREAAVKAAAAVEEAVGIRERTGLATITDLLLARQVRLQQEFDLVAARRDVSDGEAKLARAIGIAPNTLPAVLSLDTLPIPTALPASADALMAAALDGRPDLAAKFAEVRASDAEVRRARADYLPKLSGKGTLARMFREVNSLNAGPNGTSYSTDRSVWAVGLDLTWQVFDGFMRENRVIEAKAKRDRAEAELKARTLAVMAETWSAYAALRASFAQQEFADALAATTRDALDAAMIGYRTGVTNFLDLLAAERDYARTLAVRVDARAAVLEAAASLAFAVGNAGS